MKNWTKEVLDKLNEVTTVQNHPNDDNGKPLQDYPIWIVTDNNKFYLCAGKGKDSKWYKSGLKNGGAIELDGQYPIDMMVSDKCAEATVELRLK
ncbi:DUF2255 family protein [Limosilactobacillus agrestis]|uniref:DUF2255 family protein n=1 Tax=Limosilactobacillus agrestis TaxID=2759748 RepID=UPI001E4BBA58|nr:DUF2255 family protein [Limosilactobacillus agrestis]